MTGITVTVSLKILYGNYQVIEILYVNYFLDTFKKVREPLIIRERRHNKKSESKDSLLKKS